MAYSSVNGTRNLFQLTALAMALALVGCGGGGNTVDSIDPTPCIGTNCGGSGGNGGDGNSGGETPVDEINISNIVLKDTSGNVTQTITRNGAVAKVVVTDADGNGISSALVNFSGANLAFGSTNGSVITNENGEASLSVAPAVDDDTGSYTMTATVTYDGKTVSSNDYFYSLQAVDVELADLTVAETNLESGASTLVTIVTRDQSSGLFTNDVTVNFSASCGSFDNASVTSANQGNISTTYSTIDDNGQLCTGTQTITANTPNGSGNTLTAEVNIAAIEATSIVYTTEDNLILGAKSSGSASTSQIEFTVFSNGTPAANQDVNIYLLRAPSDFSFIRNGNRTSPQTLTSDASGKVKVTVYPGDVPGPVELKATLADDESVFALSKNLAIATGRPAQGGITLAVGERVILNNSVVSTSITALLTDRQGNFVPEGTSVSFVSEGGTITPSCSTNNVGQCTVTFTSQNPRPAYGRVSVLAYTEGDKAYNDLDGDNFYTVGVDTLVHNIGTLYRDDNENMQFENGEYQYSRALLGNSAACATTEFTQPNRPDTCDDALDAILRRQIVMGFADSVPSIPSDTLGYNGQQGAIYFDVYGNSTLTLPMPSKTSVNVTAEDRSKYNGEDFTCKAEIISGAETVPDDMSLNRVYMDNNILMNGFLNSPVVKYAVDVSKCVSDDKVELQVTAPDGTLTKIRLSELILEPATASITDDGVTLTGTAEPNSMVEITTASGTVTEQTDQFGDFSHTFSPALSTGDRISVKVVDGNSESQSILLTVPVPTP